MAEQVQRSPSERRGSHERGQNLVEFAFVVPIFLLFVFAIFEFGNLFRVQIELQNAAREGARFAANSATDSNIQSEVQAKVNGSGSPAADLSSVTVAISYPTACPSPTAEVKVSATYSYAVITPIGGLMNLFGAAFPNSKTLTVSSTMRSEC